MNWRSLAILALFIGLPSTGHSQGDTMVFDEVRTQEDPRRNAS